MPPTAIPHVTQVTPASTTRKIGLIFLLLIVVITGNGLYTVHQQITNDARRINAELDGKLAIATAMLANEAEKLRVVAGVLKGQQLKFIEFMDYDKIRPITIMLQSIASKHQVDLLLLVDENSNQLASSNFQPEAVAAPVPTILTEQSEQPWALAEVPLALFGANAEFEGIRAAADTILCITTTVNLIHDLGNPCGTVILIKRLTGQAALARRMSDMARADIVLSDRHNRLAFSNLSPPTIDSIEQLARSHFTAGRAMNNGRGEPIAKIMVGIDKQPILNERNRLLIGNLLSFAGAIVILVALFFFIKIRVINRITRLSSVLRAVNTGRAELDSRLPIPFSQNDNRRLDEVELMCLDFNRMMDRLESTFRQTKEQAALLQQQQEDLRRVNLELTDQADLLTKQKDQLNALYIQNKMILDAAGEGIHGMDINGLTTFVNKAALKMTGFTQADLLGKNQHDLVHHTREDGSPYPLEECPIHSSLVRSKVRQVRETLFWRKDGTSFPVEYVCSLIVEKDTIMGAVVVFKDISERKEIEAEREKIREQLLQSQKMEAVGTLAGGIAHDFNNMLTLIQGYTDMAMMRMDESDPIYDDCLKQIATSVGRAGDLTRQLLIFSRRQPMEYKPINLSGLIENLLKMLGRLIGEEITIVPRLAPDLADILGDRGNLEQIVMNLTVNGKDAMPQGGVLTISTATVSVDKTYCKRFSFARPGTFVRLSVEDNGVGMDPETQSHILEPFFSTKEAGKGTGLGLSVVYGIVKQHGGWVTVRSKPGRGSTFEIFIPTTSAKSESRSPLAEPTEHVKGSGQRILLVEDDERVCKMATTLLTENGYEVFPCMTAEEAIETFTREQGRFDLLFSDVVLPSGNGVQLADKLHSQRPELPVLLTSGYTDDKSRREIVMEKGYDFIQKPYEILNLLKTIKKIIRT